MPNLSRTLTPAKHVEFVASVPLDLLNAMYFTWLSSQIEGIDGWPADTFQRLAPDLRDEMDRLFVYPVQEPGILGALMDVTFEHREAWDSVESLLRFVNELPAAVGSRERPGVQLLVLYALRWSEVHERDVERLAAMPREELIAELHRAGVDTQEVLALYDRPEELRSRMSALIRRFYDEHYKHDLDRRLPCLERSVAAHRAQQNPDVDVLTRALAGREITCLRNEPDAYKRYVFVPSLDLGAYLSCADIAPTHGLYYSCEARFRGDREEEDAEETRRIARVYRALSDEQRIRILRLLRDGELYAQEIVERTGLHQSVVSRHLQFLKAVDLVRVRQQNNMKFYSINSQMRDELGRTLDAVIPAGKGYEG